MRRSTPYVTTIQYNNTHEQSQLLPMLTVCTFYSILKETIKVSSFNHLLIYTLYMSLNYAWNIVTVKQLHIASLPTMHSIVVESITITLKACHKNMQMKISFQMNNSKHTRCLLKMPRLFIVYCMYHETVSNCITSVLIYSIYTTNTQMNYSLYINRTENTLLFD